MPGSEKKDPRKEDHQTIKVNIFRGLSSAVQAALEQTLSK